MIAVAAKVAYAHRDGNSIFSFGFIFKRIYRQIEAEDDSWLYDLSSRLDDQADQTARKNAEVAAAVLDKAGLHYDYQRLTSTLGFEELDALLRALGEGDKQLGWRMLHEGIHSALRPGDGRIIVHWSYFDDAAQTAVRRERARVGARRRYQDRKKGF